MRDDEQRGFTLVELMVVVAVIAVLAVVAIPVYIEYVQKSRTVEVVESLSKIAHGARAYFGSHQRLPPATAAFSPAKTHAAVCTTGTGLFQADTIVDFRTPTWDALLFQPTAPYRYRYQFSVITPADPSNSAVLARAVAYGMADLDCDGVPSIWAVYLNEKAGTGELSMSAPVLFAGKETE